MAQTCDQWIAPPRCCATVELFNNLPQDETSVLADGLSCTFCGCSSAGRARPRHGRGHEFETRHPLHFGCVLSLRCRVTWCWRCGMCATLGQATCSETPHPTGCSRLGTAEVDSFALVAQQAEQPPCKRQAARSNRRRGHQNKSCSSSWLRTPGFHSGYAGSNPARDTRTRNPRGAHASRVEIGRNDWAAPEPVTGWNLLR